MKRYYQPEIETMPVEQIKALQSERLVEQVSMYTTMWSFIATAWTKRG